MSETDVRSIMREAGIPDKIKLDAIVRFVEMYNKMKSGSKRRTCALLRGKNDNVRR